MDRRTFLKSTGAGIAGGMAAGLVAPEAARARPATAEPGGREDLRVLRKLERVQRRRDHARARILERTRGEALPEALRTTYANATAAIAGIEAFTAFSPLEMVHRDAQALAVELVKDVARGAYATRALLADIAEQDFEDHESLHRAMDDMDDLLALDLEPSQAGRRVTFGTAKELRAELREEGLTRVSRRTAAKLDRIVRLSERIAETGRGLGTLRSSDPKLIAKVEQGREFWGDLAAPGMDAQTEIALLVLGIIVAGVAVLAGAYITFVMVACGLACEAPALLLIAILSGAVVLLLIAGIVAAGKRIRDIGRLAPPSAPRSIPEPEPTTGDPFREAEVICRLYDVPEDSPLASRIQVGIAAAYGRGVPRTTVRDLAGYLPDIQLYPLVLARIEYHGRWEPSLAVEEVRRIYRKKRWRMNPDAFEADLEAYELAMGQVSGARLQTVERTASKPGDLAALLGG